MFRRGFLSVLVASGVALSMSVVCLASVGAAESDTAAVARDASGAEYAAGELIVVYGESELPGARSIPTPDGVDALVEENLPDFGAQVLSFTGEGGVVGRSSGREIVGGDLAETKAALERDPAVEAVYYNYIRRGMQSANDPRFGEQYGMKKPGFPTAWGRSPKGVRVAVIDSGVDIRHPDLSGKVVAKYDFRNDNGTVEDFNGHGTHIAGIMAAKTNNGVGVAGGCPKCTIVVGKALNENLSGYDSDIAQAIRFSADKGAKVINLSLGGLGEKSLLQDAIRYANSRGAIVTAAGGNYGTNQRVYPAAYSSVVSVSYTGSRDGISSNSSYGSYQDVAAPGVDILSTVPGGGYEKRSGSSFSAPHAAALAGILRGQGRGAEATVNRIKATSVDLGSSGKDPYYGHGRISASRASMR